MRIENERSYVLESRPYRETSVLLDVLTEEHGRLAMVVRGVRGDGRRSSARRAALGLFSPLRLAFTGRGEVLSVTGVEADGAPLRPTGAALFSGLYVNELVRKLTGRGDPVPALYQRYAEWLAVDLAHVVSGDARTPMISDATSGDERMDRFESRLTWSLRRFERDLLALLGYAMALDHDGDTGEPLDPDADYALDPEHGARAWRNGSVWPKTKGRLLLVWAGEEMPGRDDAAALKQLARRVIRHHLGGVELRSLKLAMEWRSRPRQDSDRA